MQPSCFQLRSQLKLIRDVWSHIKPLKRVLDQQVPPGCTPDLLGIILPTHRTSAMSELSLSPSLFPSSKRVLLVVIYILKRKEGENKSLDEMAEWPFGAVD